MRGLSFQVLFKLWDIDYKPANNIDACSSSKDYGLKCMMGLRSLNILRNINRPAVLKLFDNDGKNYYVTLIGLNDKTAKISFGNEERNVAIKDIESQWLGDYTLLWRPPDGYKGEFRAFHEGPAVKWLRTSMSNINNGVLQDPVSNIYDRGLVIEVKKYQLAEGLVPDGIVGPQTLVHINTAIDNKVPILSGRKEKN